MGVSRETFENQVLGLLGCLQGVARRLTRNDADAEDLVAETVARAWRARDTLKSEAAFRAWIFRILNNTFISDLRRASARPRLESMACEEADEGAGGVSIFEELHQPFLLWFSNPEQEFLDKLLREDLDRALATLPELLSRRGDPVRPRRSSATPRSRRRSRSRSAPCDRASHARVPRCREILWQQAQAYGLDRRRAPPGRSATISSPRYGARPRAVRAAHGSKGRVK